MLRLLVIALAASSAGCATIVRGSSEQVQFASEPAGAAVVTSLGSGCPATPCSLEIPRKTEFTATFKAPGYADVTIPVLTRVSGGGVAGMAGNILIGGVVGVGVDAVSGSGLDHDPNPVIARMAPVGAKPGPVRRRRPARSTS